MFGAKVGSNSKSSNTPTCVPEQNIVCLTCLTGSQYRKMYPIEDKVLFSSVTLLKLPPDCDFMLCWECHSMIVKIKRFRERALQAHLVLNKEKPYVTSLTSLKSSSLVHWLSIEYQPQIEINPLIVNEEPNLLPPPNIPKEEIVESETLRTEPQGANLLEQDPFEEAPVKTEMEIADESGTSDVDTAKCEIDSDNSCNETTDEMPHLQMRKSNVAYITTKYTVQDESSGTESATEVDHPQSPPNRKSIKTIDSEVRSLNSMPSTSTVRTTNSSRVTGNQNGIVELPITFVASSILSYNLRKEDSGPVEYHHGPKLFKNSPQLAIPKIFRQFTGDTGNTDAPGNTYEVKNLTEEEMYEHRAERLRHARSRLYMYFCERCLQKFHRQIEFDLHMNKHDKSAGQFACNICELRFTAQALLDEHKAEHYKLYICDACKEKFFSFKALLNHNTRKHQDILKFCRVCDARFTNLKQYYRHNQTHKKQKECEVCHKKMEHGSYRKHMARHAQQPWERCGECRKQFRGRRRLVAHRRSAHAPQEDSAYCVECNITFKSKQLFRAHMRNSMKHVPDSEISVCQQCGKRLATRAALRQHVAVSHELSERSQCDICHKVYQSKKAIRAHIVTKHLKMKTAQRNKICDICGKAFESKSCLEQHMNSHLNIRPYKCEECGATFSYSGARYTHVRLKHRKNQDKDKTES